jgi:hypothetical protein
MNAIVRTAWRAKMVVLALSLGVPACGALRQNLKNQFVSFRGAWHCASGRCELPKMVRSTQGHREGDLKVSHVRLAPQAALVFYPGTPVETFSATISCGGQTVDVPGERVLPPGKHGISGQGDAWVIVVDPGDYALGSCDTYRVKTHSTWENGKRKYEEPGAIKVK